MRFVVLLLASLTAFAQVRRDVNYFTIPGSDGGVAIEFASPVAFQFTRWWGPVPPKRGAMLTVDPQTISVDEAPARVRLATRYIEVTIDQGLKVKSISGRELLELSRPVTQTRLTARAHPGEMFHGLGATVVPALNLRGHEVDSKRPFFFTSLGYGMYLPGATHFDIAKADPNTLSANWREASFYFYYGPSPKEILEQHVLATHTQTDLPEETLSTYDPKGVHRLPEITEANYCDSPRMLNQLSLSGDLFPALDLAGLGRYEQLIRLLPFLYDSRHSSHPELDLRRMPWQPYLVTYLREAHDRGLPFIRPLLLQFPKDAGMEASADLYMIGDEILVAPGCDVKQIKLPRGTWTDLRTNQRHAGRQSITNDSASGALPIFAKSSSLIPLVSTSKGISMELHYFPNQGAEFFVFEPGPNEYSQFHAAPAGDFLRVESESKVERTYEWILHHTSKPKSVGETGRQYREAGSRAELKPGTWFHDSVSGNLHIVSASAAAEDHIVNIF